MDPPVRAVVFDVGGTLWFGAAPPPMSEIAEMQAERLAPLLDAWGIRLPVPLEEIATQIWELGDAEGQREWDHRTFREIPLPDLIRRVTAMHGVEIGVEQADQWWRAAWLGPMRLGYQLYPDVVDVLQELHARGIRIAANSNRPCTGTMMLLDLATMGIGKYFDAGVTSLDTGYVKPHRSTFEAVIRALGVAPDEALMVGDRCEADAAGAKSVGMRTVLKLNGRYDATQCSDADFAIHDLAELLALPFFDGAGRPR